jgi:hypothetical protein
MVGSYPKMGHAPDYSWIAGQVQFTRIQGGCVYVRTAPIPTPNPANQPSPGVPIVGTAVHSDTSPPLRDITPVVGPPTTPQPIGDSFVPNGPGWDEGKVKDGDYVVLLGRVAGPGDAYEMCPGGTPYIVDRVQSNP